MGKDAISPATLTALVDEGLTVREIAARIDRHVTTTRRLLLRHGLRTTDEARTGGLDGARRKEGRCRIHGAATLALRADGAWQCTRCRAEAVTRRRRRVKAQLVAEAGGRCELCGYDRCARALHFHHRDPSTKTFTLASGGLTRSMEAMREEAAKCALLCSNCHAEVEAGLAAVDDVRTAGLRMDAVAADPSLESPLAGAG